MEGILDLGFLGVEEKNYREQISFLPIKKKKRNQELTLEEKSATEFIPKRG